MDKKILYVDMDSVLCDFERAIDELSIKEKEKYKANYDLCPYIFSILKPITGAIESFIILSKYFDTYILFTAPWGNPSAWSDKIKWVKKYFGGSPTSPIYKRLILTHHKNLNKGDYLIDDRDKNGASEFKGELIKFGSEEFPNWESVRRYLMEKI